MLPYYIKYEKLIPIIIFNQVTLIIYSFSLYMRVFSVQSYKKKNY